MTETRLDLNPALMRVQWEADGAFKLLFLEDLATRVRELEAFVGMHYLPFLARATPRDRPGHLLDIVRNPAEHLAGFTVVKTISYNSPLDVLLAFGPIIEPGMNLSGLLVERMANSFRRNQRDAVQEAMDETTLAALDVIRNQLRNVPNSQEAMDHQARLAMKFLRSVRNVEQVHN